MRTDAEYKAVLVALTKALHDAEQIFGGTRSYARCMGTAEKMIRSYDDRMADEKAMG